MTMKIDEDTKKYLTTMKKILGCKSLGATVRMLVLEELDKYCYTHTGYATVGDKIKIDNEQYEISGIGDEYVIARSSKTVIEFHKHGRIAWEAEIIDGK